MSYEESNERSRSKSLFRTTMDIGMGIFYIAIGAYLIYAKAFGNIRIPEIITAIPTIVIYILGAMLLLGGLSRFYRGIKAVLPQKKNNDSE